eukprot:Gb_12007 [translate_table: standard]
MQKHSSKIDAEDYDSKFMVGRDDRCCLAEKIESESMRTIVKIEEGMQNKDCMLVDAYTELYRTLSWDFALLCDVSCHQCRVVVCIILYPGDEDLMMDMREKAMKAALPDAATVIAESLLSFARGCVKSI